MWSSWCRKHRERGHGRAQTRVTSAGVAPAAAVTLDRRGLGSGDLGSMVLHESLVQLVVGRGGRKARNELTGRVRVDPLAAPILDGAVRSVPWGSDQRARKNMAWSPGLAGDQSLCCFGLSARARRSIRACVAVARATALRATFETESHA